MRVGLYNLEPKIFNTAMMQASQYHKQKDLLFSYWKMGFGKVNIDEKY